MGDHHGVDHIGHPVGHVRIANTAVALAFMVARVGGGGIGRGAGAEDVGGGMDGVETFEGFLQAVAEAVIGAVHGGEHGVAAAVGQFACDEDGAHGGLGIVGMIRVPAAADIVLLVHVLGDQRDLRIVRVGCEELVDVDLAEAAGEVDMILLGNALITEENEAVLGKGFVNGVELRVAEAGGDVHAGDFSADALQRADVQLAHVSILPDVPCRLFVSDRDRSGVNGG